MQCLVCCTALSGLKSLAAGGCLVLPLLQAAPYYDTSSGMADSEESTESMGREAEQYSSDHKQESPVAAAAAAGISNSRQQAAAAGNGKQQQQQHKAPVSTAHACQSHPLQPAVQSPSTARSSKKSRTEQCAGAR
jgi:hypothetical protein